MELWQLQQKQSLPLEAKIAMTQQRIREWYEHWDGEVYVSFSGGKDNGKKSIMRSPPENSRKSLRFGHKLFP